MIYNFIWFNTIISFEGNGIRPFVYKNICGKCICIVLKLHYKTYLLIQIRSNIVKNHVFDFEIHKYG